MAKKSKPEESNDLPEDSKSNDTFKSGRITNDEARLIEQLLPFSTYAEVAKQLNRKASTVRKFAQNQGISKDKISTQKHTAYEIKKDPTFKALEETLNDDEIVVCHEIYTKMCEQFGNDILYSEKQEILDFGTASCLLTRELKRDKEIEDAINEKAVLRDTLKKAKRAADNDVDSDEDVDELMDMLDDIEIEMADLKDEKNGVKARQEKMMERKDRFRKSLYVSRNARANDLVHATENFTALTEYLKKNPEYRKEMGLAGEKMRLAVSAEWFRLTEFHKYADGSIDLPLISHESVKRHLDAEKLELENENNA